MIRDQLRRLVSNAIIDSPLEHILRTAYTRLSRARNDRYDREMMAVMRRVMHSRSNGVDVGCYRGEVLRNMIKLSPKGSHFAFEPTPKNFQYLAQKFKTASVFNLALSDYTGESTFQHVIDRPARSGFY